MNIIVLMIASKYNHENQESLSEDHDIAKLQ